MIDDVLARVPMFLLVVFRMAGVMAVAPMFSSARTPKRVKALVVVVLSLGVCGTVPPTPLPGDVWTLAVGVGGELAFGVAMGMLVSFTFVAAQWAGQMIGMEMGLNMSEVFDPSMGAEGSLVGDLLYFLALAVFLSVDGHKDLLAAVRASFVHLPPLTLGIDRPMVVTMAGMFQSATIIAVRLAAPVLITVMVVDLSLGLIGRAMPQFNVTQAGLSIRSIIGMVILIAGLTTTAGVIERSVVDALDEVRLRYGGAA